MLKIKALKELQKEKSNIIFPVHKGRATVIMETDEYQEKMTTLISDKAIYEKLEKNPTRKFKAELIRMTNAIEKEETITKDQYWFLR